MEPETVIERTPASPARRMYSKRRMIGVYLPPEEAEAFAALCNAESVRQDRPVGMSELARKAIKAVYGIGRIAAQEGGE